MNKSLMNLKLNVDAQWTWKILYFPSKIFVQCTYKYVHKCIYEDISKQKSNTGLESNLNLNKIIK